jgi:hypothetical protein
MILATQQAFASKFVPWEIGIADEIKGEKFILLIPVTDSGGRFQGNEYLQLYNHLDFGPRQFADWSRSPYRVLSAKQQDKGSLLEYLQALKSCRSLLS